jgi:hypothetical protein
MGELPNTPGVEAIATPEQIKGPELLGFKIMDQVRTLSAGGFFMDEGVSELAGRSIQEIAEKADRRTVGFSTQQVATGSVEIEGQTIELTSEPFDRSGTSWVDGEVLTLEQVKTRMPTEKTLIANMEGNGWSSIVKTRAGSFQPFVEGDSVVSSVPKSESR